MDKRSNRLQLHATTTEVDRPENGPRHPIEADPQLGIAQPVQAEADRVHGEVDGRYRWLLEAHTVLLQAPGRFLQPLHCFHDAFAQSQPALLRLVSQHQFAELSEDLYKASLRTKSFRSCSSVSACSKVCNLSGRTSRYLPTACRDLCSAVRNCSAACLVSFSIRLARALAST